MTRLDVVGWSTLAVFATLVVVHMFPQMLLLPTSSRVGGGKVKVPSPGPRLDGCERIRKVHVHVVSVGDSLTLGVTGSIDVVHPYASAVAARLEGRTAVGPNGCLTVVSTSSSVLGYSGLSSAQIHGIINALLINVKSPSAPFRASFLAAVEEAMEHGADEFVVAIGVLLGANDAIIVSKSLFAAIPPALQSVTSLIPEGNDISVNSTVTHVLGVAMKLESLFSALVDERSRSSDNDDRKAAQSLKFHRLFLAMEQVPQILLPAEGRQGLLATFCPLQQVDPMRICPLLCESVWSSGDANQRRLKDINDVLFSAASRMSAAAAGTVASRLQRIRDPAYCRADFLTPYAEGHGLPLLVNETRMRRLYSDCMHLSRAGYSLWSQNIAASIEASLHRYFH